MTQERSKSEGHNFTPHPPEVKQAAHQLFMDHVGRKAIAERLKISEETVNSWAFKNGWVAERNGRDKDFIGAVTERLTRQMSITMSDALDLVQAAIKSRTTTANQQSVTLAEAKDLATIMTMLHKLTRLDQGLETDIVTVKALSTKADIEHAITVLKADPMLTDAEVVSDE